MKERERAGVRGGEREKKNKDRDRKTNRQRKKTEKKKKENRQNSRVQPRHQADLEPKQDPSRKFNKSINSADKETRARAGECGTDRRASATHDEPRPTEVHQPLLNQ